MCFPGPQGFLGFLNIVMGGLLSETPHTISATVQGLSRLVHKFYRLLQSVADKLLMTILMLVRAKCKEVDASVLGFVNVRFPPLDEQMSLKYVLYLSAHEHIDILSAIAWS